MKHRIPKALIALLLQPLLLATPGAAQDEDFPIGPPIPMEGARGGSESPQEQMMRLFREVELELRRIDVLLNDAGAGETRLASVRDSGIADLLRQSRESSESVIAGIDEILTIAAQQGQGQGQGQNPSEGQSSSDNPMNRPGGQSQGDRENTPQAEDMPSRPEQAQEGDQPEPGAGEEPRSPQDSSAEPELEPNQRPPGSERGAPAAPSGDDEWGLLPPRAREVFRSRGADDLPARYRDWIEGYYRRLNRVP